ncbi:LOW QUALITY PROTEIN: cell division cycle-associated protein 2 [Hippopotamus amphibius kiboko]|uniref:LOW QUALITY PROTEIN: cell division cycle-associated protein 2 n=1 Tax=Hippopotamus amphibius kiboko TaxID=575201 RepID=UPI002597311E|nr:LOW QUALITY PROTEIN: cell division cycle-associated protein 2 [Hippopotamus amphibius kiboko]
MDDSSKDSKPLETKESAINNAENASFVLGNGKLVTPHKPAAEMTSNPCMSDTFKSPLNFSTVTVEQLGITPESFVKNSSGESSSYLKKSRRRSTVGVRGSPETNHLIRFIAQQRNLKNASLTKNSPFQGSPVLYRNVHSLREQISAFQSAFHSIKENEKMTDCLEFSEAEGEFKTIGSAKKESRGERQQSEFPANLSSKRQRISSPSSSDGNLTDAVVLQIGNVAAFPNTDRRCPAETFTDLSEKSSESGLNLQSGCLVEESSLISELTEASSGIQIADCVEGRGASDAVSVDKFTEVSTDTAPEARPLVTSLCQRDIPSSKTFVLRSVLKKPSAKLCLESLQEHRDNLCDGETHPSSISNLANCCKERKAEGRENCKVPASLNMRKRKRVTFGEDLSPEVFDESLPANTPLRKGETPVRKKDLSSLSPQLLEQSPVPERLPQPNFDDKGENLENIEPLQVSFAVLSPLSNSSVSETVSGTVTFASSNTHDKIASCKVGRATRTSNRRSQLISFSEESVCNLFNTEPQPCKEKKINRRKSQESKRADRALPRKNQVLKSCRKKKAKGKKKSVQKSLYGERDIASKKPLLSPIPELPEVSETPLVPSVQRICSDDFNSNGELEEVKLPKRKNLLPQNPEDWQITQGFNKYDVSEFCSSDMKSSSSLMNATFEQDSNTNTIEINENKAIPKAAIKLESENELKTGTENENSHVSCAPVTETPIVSDNPKPDFTLPSQELSAAGQNVENLFQIFKISEDINIKCEKQDDFLVIPEGKLQTKHLMPDSQKECDYSDVLIDHIKESTSQSEDLGRSSTANSSGVSYRERKHRRYSMACSDGHSLHFEKTENPKPSYSVSSSVEISLENSQLYKDLSDSIEQTFQRTKSETKVRRSTRLQKGLESEEGLVWISLPLPPASCTSQRTKRRTIGTSDSRGFEDGSSWQKPCALPSTSGEENSEGFAAAAAATSLPGRRRKSFCTSALADPKNTTQSRGYKRTFLNQKGESSPSDFERIGHIRELKQ